MAERLDSCIDAGFWLRVFNSILVTARKMSYFSTTVLEIFGVKLWIHQRAENISEANQIKQDIAETNQIKGDVTVTNQLTQATLETNQITQEVIVTNQITQNI